MEINERKPLKNYVIVLVKYGVVMLSSKALNYFIKSNKEITKYE